MRRSWIALAVLALPVLSARAEEPPTADRLEALEQRVDSLERERDDLRAALHDQTVHETAGGGLADWTRRIRLSGSANTGFYHGGETTPFEDASNFQVWDARFFLDADLGRDVSLGGTPIVRNVGFSFEWNLVRLGELQDGNFVGELYTDLQGIGGLRWLNAQVGRFYIPVGEAYLRFGKGYRDNPFITNTLGGPWWWDEGVRLYGSFREDQLGYVASISDGETSFSDDGRRDPQATLKLWARPFPWLYMSASALRSGQVGSREYPAAGALWLGETWANGIGSLSGVPTFQHGAELPPGPTELDSTQLFGSDVVLTHPKLGRLWLGVGRYAIDVQGPSRYNRDLFYWIAEYVIGGAVISPELAPLYLALRANALGTYDSDKGYLLDIRQSGSFGYNMQSETAYSIALGWHLSRWTTLRAEYTHQVIELVHGVPQELRDDAGGTDYFGFELGAAF
jgi:hypothetical protein